MAQLFVYRNCFSGDISGGDMHTGGFCKWVHEQHPEIALSLVHPAGDGQEKFYAETASLDNITYQDTTAGNLIAKWLLRARLGAKISLPLADEPTLLVAGSHLIADVWPVYKQGARRKNVKRMVYIHHVVQDMPRAKGFNTLAANWHEKICFWLIKRRYDKIITVNEEVVASLRKRGFKQDILVSSNFVNDNTSAPKAYVDKDIDLTFCGRFVEQKGIFDFLAVCEKLQTNNPNFRAAMMGVGPRLDDVREQVATKHLSIEVLGRVEEAQKFDMHARSKLFVFPSIEEGWGIVVAEALSSGTPVLAYDLPVYRDIFGTHMHVVPLKDTAALVESAAQLLHGYRKNPADYVQEQQAIVTFAKAFQRGTVIQKEFDFVMEPAYE
ncbi:MAG: glycosyltransferase family 4 protein [Candidatus Saccharibacteria bacterium]